MKTIVFFIAFITFAVGQTTLIDPALYARKYSVEDPYKQLKVSFSSPITQKTIKTTPGTPKVQKIYPPAITRALMNYKNVKERTKVYAIQVYSHSDKQKVLNMKARAKAAYPQYNFIIVFERPFFKLRAIPFNSREDANKAKMELKKGFPGAFIVVPK